MIAQANEKYVRVKGPVMKHPVTVPSIPPALALRLCTEIRTEVEG
jgi:hypothetical protein